jgi:hypothetical protein
MNAHRHSSRRRRWIQTAILATLDRLGGPVTAAELSASGHEMRGIRSRDRDLAIQDLVRHGQVVAGKQVRLHWGAAVVFEVFALASSAGRRT